MNIQEESAHGIAIATGAVLSALLRHLEAMEILKRPDVRAILNNAQVAIDRLGSVAQAKSASNIVASLHSDFPKLGG